MTKPSRAVYAEKIFEKDEYVVVAASHNMFVADPTTKCPAKSVEIIVKIHGGYRVIMNPHYPDKKFASQFWNIFRTGQRDDANCIFSYDVAKFRMPTLSEKNTNEILHVSIPVIKNFKQIAKNEEIIVFNDDVADECTKKRKSTHVALEPKKGDKKQCRT